VLVNTTVVKGRLATVVLVVDVLTGFTRAAVLVVIDVTREVDGSVVEMIGWVVATRGVEFDAVKVRTRTSSKRGLDHVTQ
jgi:hypothetical protein